MNTKKGLIIITDDSGNIKVFEQQFPIETHAVGMGWAMDLLRAIQEFGNIRRFILRVVLGKCAYRELVGLDDALNQYGYDTHIGYDLQGCNYHQDKVKF